FIVPSVLRLQPILAKQVIPIRHEIWQWLLFLSRSVKVILNFGIHVDMIEPRFVRARIWQRIIADYDSRRLYQSRFNRVVKSKVTYNPSKESFFGCLFAAWRK